MATILSPTTSHQFNTAASLHYALRLICRFLFSRGGGGTVRRLETLQRAKNKGGNFLEFSYIYGSKLYKFSRDLKKGAEMAEHM